jgi:hypothetical protein
MASRRLARRWMMRDIPKFLVLFAGIAVVFAILGNSVDWNLLRAEFAGGGKSDFASKPNIVSKQQPNNGSNAELYTGSIILVPTQAEQCLERALDNRTRQTWDKGYVNCYDVVRNTAKNSGLSTSRLRSIGTAFLHNPPTSGREKRTAGFEPAAQIVEMF